MPDIVYPLDLTGVNPSNLVSNELHTTTESNFRDYFFIIPNFAPFFIDNFSLKQIVNGIETPLVEGVHYTFALEYLSGTRVTGKPMYGAISLNNPDQSALLKTSYQTLGGESVANRLYVLQTLADMVYNPRITLWELVTDKPDYFPPSPHYQDLPSTFGMNELITAINGIVQAIVDGRDESPFIRHLVDQNNPHAVTLQKLGFTLANAADVSTHTATDKLVTPASLTNLIQTIQEGTGLDATAVQALINQALANLPAPAVSDTITGPSVLYSGSEQSFQISNYDLGKTYTLTPKDPDWVDFYESNGKSKGFISSWITDVPHTGGFTLNSRVVDIPVVDYPTLPVQRIRNTFINNEGPTELKPGISIDAIHIDSYQYIDGGPPVDVPGHDIVVVGNAYYGRSSAIQTLTGDTDVGEGILKIYKETSGVFTEIASINSPYSGDANKQGFGFSVAISKEQDIFAVSHKYITGHTTTSEIRIYKRDSITQVWSYAYTITSPDLNDGFGYALSFGKYGDKLAITAPLKNKVYIFNVTPVTHSLNSVIDGIDYGLTSADKFGISVSLTWFNNTGFIAIGIDGYLNNVGGVFTATYDSGESSWFPLNDILTPNLTVGKFGCSVSMLDISDAPSILAVGDVYNGSVYIYELTHLGWKLEGNLTNFACSLGYCVSTALVNKVENSIPTIFAAYPTYQKDNRAITTDTITTTEFGGLAVIEKTQFGWEIVAKVFPSGNIQQGFFSHQLKPLSYVRNDLPYSDPNAHVNRIFTLMSNQAIVDINTSVPVEQLSLTLDVFSN